MAASLYNLHAFQELERIRIWENGVAFKLKGIPRMITIRSHWDIPNSLPQRRQYEIRSNYAIKTPGMAQAYRPGKILASNENQAILEYVAKMLEYYRIATRQRHHRPSASWLRPVPAGW